MFKEILRIWINDLYNLQIVPSQRRKQVLIISLITASGPAACFFSKFTTSVIFLFIASLSMISTYFLGPVALSTSLILFWKEMSFFPFNSCKHLKWLLNTSASIDYHLFRCISFTRLQNALDSWILSNIELRCSIFAFFRLDLIDFVCWKNCPLKYGYLGNCIYTRPLEFSSFLIFIKLIFAFIFHYCSICTWRSISRKCVCTYLVVINSPAPGICGGNFKSILFKLVAQNRLAPGCEISFRWMPHNLTNDKSTLVQVMTWCRHTTNHYLSKYWLRYMSPCMSVAHSDLQIFIPPPINIL